MCEHAEERKRWLLKKPQLLPNPEIAGILKLREINAVKISADLTPFKRKIMSFSVIIVV